MTGTGGNFLCHFLIAAKNNIKNTIPLSVNGNAHDRFKDFYDTCIMGPKDLNTEKINFVLKQKLIENTLAPYFTTIHITNNLLLSKSFNKAIQIIYEYDDIKDLVYVIYGKYNIDTDAIKKFSTVDDITRTLEYWNKNFQQDENLSNILYVSWKELYEKNIDTLVQRLSIFTNINKNNFCPNIINQWRDKTKDCVNKYRNAVYYEQ